MKCEYCGEENYYGQHTCRAQIVAKDVEIHALETKLKNAERKLEHLKARVEAVLDLDWDLVHLITNCKARREFYTCLQLLDRFYQNNYTKEKD